MSRILIVDDDVGLLLLIGEYLESCGFEFELAKSARQARDHLARGPFDTVLSDLEMPEESGFDLFNHILSDYPATGFVLMTGRIERKLRCQATQMGIGRYIEKPFRLLDLGAMLAGPA